MNDLRPDSKRARHHQISGPELDYNHTRASYEDRIGQLYQDTMARAVANTPAHNQMLMGEESYFREDAESYKKRKHSLITGDRELAELSTMKRKIDDKIGFFTKAFFSQDSKIARENAEKKRKEARKKREKFNENNNNPLLWEKKRQKDGSVYYQNKKTKIITHHVPQALASQKKITQLKIDYDTCSGQEMLKLISSNPGLYESLKTVTLSSKKIAIHKDGFEHYLYLLRNLETLTLLDCPELRYINVNCFVSLKTLNLNGCTKLTELRFGETSNIQVINGLEGCANLKLLTISGCNNLRLVDFQIPPSLSRIQINITVASNKINPKLIELLGNQQVVERVIGNKLIISGLEEYFSLPRLRREREKIKISQADHRVAIKPIESIHPGLRQVYMHTVECFFVEFTRHLKHACRPLSNIEIMPQPIEMQGGVYVDEGGPSREFISHLTSTIDKDILSISPKESTHLEKGKLYRNFGKYLGVLARLNNHSKIRGEKVELYSGRDVFLDSKNKLVPMFNEEILHLVNKYVQDPHEEYNPLQVIKCMEAKANWLIQWQETHKNLVKEGLSEWKVLQRSELPTHLDSARKKLPCAKVEELMEELIAGGVIEEEEGGDLINAFYQHHKSIQEKIKNELKTFHEKEQKVYRPFIRGLREGTFVPAPNFDFVEDIIGGTYTVENFFTNLDRALQEAKRRNPQYGGLLERRINELKRYVENHKTDSEKMAAAKRILQAITANTSNSKISIGIISWAQQNPWAKIQTCSNTLYFSTSEKKLTNEQIHQLLEHCQQGYGSV